MHRYLAVRQRVCEFVQGAIEFGPFERDVSNTDALCDAVARMVPSSDAVAILEEVLASRGILLSEGRDGEWGWAGVRLK